MQTKAASEFRRAFAITAIGLSLPAVVELVTGFGRLSEGAVNILIWTPVFGLCLIALAGILVGLLAAAGYGRQAKGVALGAGVGLLSLAAAVGLLVWTHSV